MQRRRPNFPKLCRVTLVTLALSLAAAPLFAQQMPPQSFLSAGGNPGPGRAGPAPSVAAPGASLLPARPAMVQQATYQGAQPPQPAPDRPASSPNYPSPQRPEEIPALRPTRIDGSQIPPNLANVWTL